MRLGGRHFAASGLLAVGLHAGALAWFVLSDGPKPPAEPEGPATKVSLGQIGGARSAAPETPAPNAEAAAPPPQAAAETAPPETRPEPDPEPVQTAAATPETPPEPVPETATAPPPLTADPVASESAADVAVAPEAAEPPTEAVPEPTPTPEVAPAPEPDPARSEPIEAVEAAAPKPSAPRPRTRPDPPPTPAETPTPPAPEVAEAPAPEPEVEPAPAPDPAPTKTAAAPAPTAATAAESAESASTEVTARRPGNDGRADQAAPAGGLGRPPETYLEALQVHLLAYKRYPRAARRREQEGVVKVRMTVHRDGRVSAITLVESSGHRLLDAETRDMIRRAEPLPPMPEDFGRDRLTLVVPVRFALR